jgi:hypothetical protein
VVVARGVNAEAVENRAAESMVAVFIFVLGRKVVAKNIIMSYGCDLVRHTLVCSCRRDAEKKRYFRRDSR